jgi:hypothetical protein
LREVRGAADHVIGNSSVKNNSQIENPLLTSWLPINGAWAETSVRDGLCHCLGDEVGQLVWHCAAV